jgi:hypothetical protein
LSTEKNLELERALANPPNFIMSDSLEGILDDDWSEELTPWETTDVKCEIYFSDYSIAGDLKGFTLSDTSLSLILRSTTSQVMQAISCYDTHVSSVECSYPDGKVFWAKEFQKKSKIRAVLEEDNKSIVIVNLQD